MQPTNSSFSGISNSIKYHPRLQASALSILLTNRGPAMVRQHRPSPERRSCHWFRPKCLFYGLSPVYVWARIFLVLFTEEFWGTKSTCNAHNFISILAWHAWLIHIQQTITTKGLSQTGYRSPTGLGIA